MSLKTKQILIYALVAILVFSGITAAAQAFAPDNLKPFKVAKSESSSSSSSSSVSSSPVSSSSLSSLSSTSSVVSSNANSSSKSSAVNTQTYTNPFFPDFKLVYPEDWKFETSTRESEYLGIVNRNIVLSKQGLRLQIGLNPFSPNYLGNCGGYFGDDVKIEEVRLPSNVLKYKFTSQNLNTIAYGTNGIECPWNSQLVTNINGKNIQTYSQMLNSFKDDSSRKLTNRNQVVYTYYIDFSKDGLPYELNELNPLASEIDQIISQSSFK